MSNEKVKSKRDTRQREAISKAFENSGRPLSPKELLEIASQWVPNIGIATIYRNIKIMVNEESLVSIPIPAGPPRYYLPGRSYKAIFICEKTDRTFFLDDAHISFSTPESVDGLQIKSASLFYHGVAPVKRKAGRN